MRPMFQGGRRAAEFFHPGRAQFFTAAISWAAAGGSVAVRSQLQ
jgi:hypothetical protein